MNLGVAVAAAVVVAVAAALVGMEMDAESLGGDVCITPRICTLRGHTQKASATLAIFGECRLFVYTRDNGVGRGE